VLDQRDIVLNLKDIFRLANDPKQYENKRFMDGIKEVNLSTAATMLLISVFISGQVSLLSQSCLGTGSDRLQNEYFEVHI
jgi:hypothetical protein